VLIIDSAPRANEVAKKLTIDNPLQIADLCSETRFLSHESLWGKKP
jgi:hypothetical protein